MTNLLKSKTAAWCAFIFIIVVIALTFKMREVWWAFFDEFFAFMMVFCQLVAVYIARYNSNACRKLHTCAAVFGIIMILALIGEFITYQTLKSI